LDSANSLEGCCQFLPPALQNEIKISLSPNKGIKFQLLQDD